MRKDPKDDRRYMFLSRQDSQLFDRVTARKVDVDEASWAIIDLLRRLADIGAHKVGLKSA